MVIRRPASVNTATVNPPATPITNVVATPFSPTKDQDVTVVATVDANGVDPILSYRVNFGSVQTVAMKDDGVAPDVTPGDGVFAAAIPDQNSGDLIRYKIEAPGTGEVYPNSEGREYTGVVVTDPNEIPTGLVKLEWFISDSDYTSMFNDPRQDVTVVDSVLAIDGVVHDNIEVAIRGGIWARANLDKQGLGFDFPVRCRSSQSGSCSLPDR